MEGGVGDQSGSIYLKNQGLPKTLGALPALRGTFANLHNGILQTSPTEQVGTPVIHGKYPGLGILSP